jgi:hypothetical protein
MSEEGGVIIIKGGSVHLSFDGTLYQKVSDDPIVHKHDDRKITRVQVENEDGKFLYDSGQENLDGLKWTITVTTK